MKPKKPKTPAAPETKDIKIIGTKEKPAIKIFDIMDCKVTEEDGLVVIRGYGNTKGHPDRYGDIPTVFPSIRNYVYELSEFLKNPVMLLDHSNSVSAIAGSFPEIVEDEVGLRFKAVFSKSVLPEIAHARTVFMEGHAKAFSIAGRWHYEDPANKNNLTYAEIYHISPVGVGADPDALGYATEEVPGPKAAGGEGDGVTSILKYCICPKDGCDYWTPKEAADAAKETACPECESTLVMCNTKHKTEAAPAKPAISPEELKAKLSELVSAVGGEAVKQQLKNSILELKKVLGT